MEHNSRDKAPKTQAPDVDSGAGRTCGQAIRMWRERRHLSQKELASIAGVSGRHISFIETGRSNASRKMVLRLCEVMDLPYRARNQILKVSGFDAAFDETDIESINALDISSTLDVMLGRYEPGPAVVLDGRWNILRTNEAAQKLLTFLMGDETLVFSHGSNLINGLIEHKALRAFITNWNEVAVEIIRKLHRNIETNGSDTILLEMLEKLPGTLDQNDGPRHLNYYNTAASEMVVPIVIKRSGVTMTFFAASTRFSTPRDITMQELSIEALLPACQDTQEALKLLQISTFQ